MKIYLLVNVFFIFLCITLLNLESKAQPNFICNCVEIQKHKKATNIDWCSDANLSESKRMEIIECLLESKGDKTPFLGVVINNYVSQTFGPSPFEVVALFHISYLFYGKKDFADAMVLVNDEDEEQNSNRSIKIAYKAYKKWFKKVKKVGFEEARKQKLDPLIGSGVSWY